MSEDEILALVAELDKAAAASGPYGVSQQARELGLTCLGDGCYGFAVLLRDGRVLKSGIQDHTMVWIHAAAEVFRATGEPGKYMPKVWGFGQQSDERWWAVMERVNVGVLPAVTGSLGAVKEHLRKMLDRLGVPSGNPDMHSGNYGVALDDPQRLVIFDPAAGCNPAKLRTLWTRYEQPTQRIEPTQLYFQPAPARVSRADRVRLLELHRRDFGQGGFGGPMPMAAGQGPAPARFEPALASPARRVPVQDPPAARAADKRSAAEDGGPLMQAFRQAMMMRPHP